MTKAERVQQLQNEIVENRDRQDPAITLKQIHQLLELAPEVPFYHAWKVHCLKQLSDKGISQRGKHRAPLLAASHKVLELMPAWPPGLFMLTSAARVNRDTVRYVCLTLADTLLAESETTETLTEALSYLEAGADLPESRGTDLHARKVQLLLKLGRVEDACMGIQRGCQSPTANPAFTELSARAEYKDWVRSDGPGRYFSRSTPGETAYQAFMRLNDWLKSHEHRRIRQVALSDPLPLSRLDRCEEHIGQKLPKSYRELLQNHGLPQILAATSSHSFVSPPRSNILFEYFAPDNLAALCSDARAALQDEGELPDQIIKTIVPFQQWRDGNSADQWVFYREDVEPSPEPRIGTLSHSFAFSETNALSFDAHVSHLVDELMIYNVYNA